MNDFLNFTRNLKTVMSRVTQLPDLSVFLWRATDWDCEAIKAISSIKLFMWMDKNI